MTPDVEQQALKLAEQVRQRLLAALREKSEFRRQEQVSAALELVAKQTRLLRPAA